MNKRHLVIVIPGLGDETRILQLAVNHWKKNSLDPVVYSIGWSSGIAFQPKLQKLVTMIDGFIDKGARVSLVGTSAGGSAALNAFIKRKETIHRVINICGRLRTGPLTGFRSFKSKTASSPAFADSIKLCEREECKLTILDRQKIMTVSALFGDELVPGETTIIKGALNTKIPTAEHIVSIGMALTLFSRPLISFLKQK